MKYLSFLTRLKKVQYFLLVVIIVLGFTTEASAKWCVVCWPPYGCMAIKAACDDFHRPRKSTCQDLPIAFKPSDHLYREKDGGASFTIDGKSYKIASDACESFLLNKKTTDANTTTQNEKFQKEFETFMKTDRGFVSDNRLKQISQEFHLPITNRR